MSKWIPLVWFHTSARSRGRVLGGVAALVALAVLVVAAVPTFRTAALRAIGHALVIPDQPVDRADIVIITVDAYDEGVLEAAALVRAGIASRVAIFAAIPERAEVELLERQIEGQDAAARAVDHLAVLGVSDAERIPPRVTGTTEEAPILRDWCEQRGVRSAVVVTSADHSRRLWRVLARTVDPAKLTLTVRAARFSAFDPDRWWEQRTGTRIAIIELEKLLLDYLLHPFSG
jgi:uncharacterized SAM-binding protein YcdF (DUF218 family)